MDIVNAVDFDVLVLLASIMAINHIIMHLKETKYCINIMQNQIKRDPVQGFWMVSFVAFIVAPFLTNDGVCLLFVEIILNTFDENVVTQKEENHQKEASKIPLNKRDAIYFLLTLACSSNIGSALTYTGNPQNMIVAQDAVSVMSPLKFLGLMILPTILSWIISKFNL
jgi:Na+/H+ antiporter NhaD/arsenite permease-like protein